MKIFLSKLLLITFLFAEHINIDNYLISNEYDKHIMIYESKISFDHKEEINIKRNCNYHIRYVPNKISKKVFYTKYNYKICKEKNQLIRFDQDESYVILDSSGEWTQIVQGLTTHGDKRIPISYQCKINKIYSNNLFNKLHKILYIECKDRNKVVKTYLLANKLGKIKEYIGKNIERLNLIKIYKKK